MCIRDSFRAYCQTYPDNATLLVDTSNSLQSGVPTAIRAFNAVLRPKGITHCGIRFDSGDIAYLTKKARKMLDDEMCIRDRRWRASSRPM